LPANRTCIVREPVLNVPQQVAAGLEDTLRRSVNVANQLSKRQKFCFSTSEDAVTWTIFSWLVEAEALDLVPAAAGLGMPPGRAELLLWGCPQRSGHELADDLKAVCDELGENPERRSEPDVILAWPNTLIFVEVKYRAPNDRRPGYGNFDRYLKRNGVFAKSPEEVAAAGYYELVRNWRIGTELAERTKRPVFLLLNLGPVRLARRDAGLAELFATTPTRTFSPLSWSALIQTMRKARPLPDWLDAYIAERELESRQG
jgi:hypothetical protein